MASVQFFGRESTVTAFRHRAVDTWAIFSGSDLITSGVGDEQLDEFLKMLEPGGTQAIYTLKVYRDIEDPEDITNKTECNGSFRFKLGTTSVGGVGWAAVTERLDKLEQKLSGPVDDKDEESITDILMGYLREPEKIATVLGAFRGLIAPMMAAQPAAVAGFTTKQPEPMGKIMTEDEKLNRLGAALDILEKRDPKIVEHLEKLAQLAETEPEMFKMVIKKLDAL